MKKRHLIIATIAMCAASTSVFADETLGTEQTVCQSSKYEYEVDPVTSGANYVWDFTGLGTANTDYKLTDAETDHHLIQIEWVTTSNSRVMTSREVSSDGCYGPIKETTVTVNPKPVGVNTESTLCSSGQGTPTVAAATKDDVYNQDLAAKDKNNYDIDKWDIAYKNPLPSDVTMTGATIPATGVTDKTVLKNMKFTNTGSISQDVVINVTPYIGDCVGDPYTITIHVLPEVKEHTVKYRAL